MTQHRIQVRFVKENIRGPVSRAMEDTIKLAMLAAQKRVQNYMLDVPWPRIQTKIVEATWPIPQECTSKRIVERTVDASAPQVRAWFQGREGHLSRELATVCSGARCSHARLSDRERKTWTLFMNVCNSTQESRS